MDVAAVPRPFADDRFGPNQASVTVSIKPLRRLTGTERDAVGNEGRRLATFLGDGADGASRCAEQHSPRPPGTTGDD
jgi:hypothetical protein